MLSRLHPQDAQGRDGGPLGLGSLSSGPATNEQRRSRRRGGPPAANGTVASHRPWPPPPPPPAREEGPGLLRGRRGGRKRRHPREARPLLPRKATSAVHPHLTPCAVPRASVHGSRPGVEASASSPAPATARLPPAACRSPARHRRRRPRRRLPPSLLPPPPASSSPPAPARGGGNIARGRTREPGRGSAEKGRAGERAGGARAQAGPSRVRRRAPDWGAGGGARRAASAAAASSSSSRDADRGLARGLAVVEAVVAAGPGYVALRGGARGRGRGAEGRGG